MIVGKYPSLRLRRNRKSSWTRKLIQENTLSPNDFILPIFLIDGVNKKQHIKSMPGVYRYSVDRISQIIDKAISKGIPMVALFPNTKKSLKEEINSTIAAREIAGIPKRKESLAASPLSHPDIKALEIVIPDLETPGKIANA